MLPSCEDRFSGAAVDRVCCATGCDIEDEEWKKSEATCRG